MSASRCDSCHNGSYTGEGTKGAQGTASFPGHVATNGSDCVTCHASAASAFTSWSGGNFTHAATDTNCSNCHNGTTATGMTTPPHIPVTGVQCSNCHTNTAASFTTYTMGVRAHRGERQPLRLLPQRLVHRRGHQGRAGHGVVPRPRRDQRQRLHHLSRQRGLGLHQLGGRQVHPRGDRHQLLELPQRHDRDRHDDAAAYPGDRRPVQQLPHQYGGELHDLHDEPHGGQRQPLRLLSQRLVHQRGHEGRAGHGVVPRPRRDQRQRLHHLSRQRGHDLHQLGGRQVHPRGDRHQLLELPQRHHRDRHDDAAAHSGDGDPVQQLPHQYGGEFHDLYDDPHGRHLEPLRFLPQRLVYQPGHQGRARQIQRPSQDDRGLRLLPYEHDEFWPAEEFSGRMLDDGNGCCGSRRHAAAATPVTAAKTAVATTTAAPTTAPAATAPAAATQIRSCDDHRSTSSGACRRGAAAATKPASCDGHRSTEQRRLPPQRPQRRANPAAATITAAPTPARCRCGAGRGNQSRCCHDYRGNDSSTCGGCACRRNHAVPPQRDPAAAAAAPAAASARSRLPRRRHSYDLRGAKHNHHGESERGNRECDRARRDVGGHDVTQCRSGQSVSPNAAASKPALALPTACCADRSNLARSILDATRKPATRASPPAASPATTASLRPASRRVHIVTSAPCETCHKSTVTFAGARMNHTGITANCASCHNGRAAPGKSSSHLITNASCETCHKSTATFAGARMNHTGITANLRELPQRHRRARQAAKSPRHQRALRDLPQEHRDVRGSPHEPHGNHRELRQLS